MQQASGWDKFVLLTWKNWLIQIRHPVQTFFEIAVPVIVCSLIILIRGLVDVTKYDEFRYDTLITNNISMNIRNVSRTNLLVYSPENPVLGNLMRLVADEYAFELRAETNSSTLEAYAVRSEPFASFQFDDELGNAVQLPNELNYAIRFPSELRTEDEALQRFTGFFFNWATNIKVTNEFSVGPRNRLADDGGSPPGYINQGFIALQNSLERQYIALSTSTPLASIPQIMIQRFPFPAYVDDVIGFILEFILPLLFLIAFLYNCINIIKYITIEKELQLKEAMKIMGLPSWLHWLAWFFKCMIFMIIIISMITGLFKIPFGSRGDLSVFTHADWSVLWFFMFVYVLAAVTYSFMFSTFFNRANIASIVGAIVWFTIQVPYTLINQNFETTSTTTKLVASLLCNSGMGFGFKLMTKYEAAQVGAQWNNLFNSPLPDQDLTLGAVIVMMLIASVLQMLVALYVEKILPGEFGVAEKFYFPFMPSFWCGGNDAKIHVDHESPTRNHPDFEDEPTSRTVGVQVRGLRKVYDKKVAVKNLNLNMYEDQITVLLGHNGAGKSTTMSMLTGLFKPTSGTAYIYGKDIQTEMNHVRNSLGLCPQHNVLFNELTVKEHITFFSKLKGMKSSQDIDEQIRKYVDLLELQPKLNAQSKTLSGGMKRKLSIGIALCGDSKIVMCDEPTSGMDPSARRALWDLLIQEKKGRTILLTTHFMDEADVLGDRIAIMADGDLKTVGSSFFLKKRHGAGYRLICVKATGCDPRDLTNVLQRYIPGIEIETNIGSELSYVLNENYRKQFRVIFSELESRSQELKISSFGVSLTTLEEVFLKVGSDSIAVNEEADSSGGSSHNGNEHAKVNGNGTTDDALKMTYSDFVYGPQLVLSQINAMASKKLLYSIRNYILLAIQFVTPALFVVLTMLSTANFAGNRNLPFLPISFREYPETVTTLQATNLVSGSIEDGIRRSYEELWKNLPKRDPYTNHEIRIIDTDFEDEILRQYGISTSRVNFNFMIGASFTPSGIIAWFQNQAFHTAPLTINVMNNAILRQITAADTTTVRRINLINKPLPFTQTARLDRLGAGDNVGFQIAFNTGFAMGFVIALYVMFYIKERVSRAKLLQLVSGVNKFIFWFTSFIIDYSVFILISIVYILVLWAYQEDGYTKFDELGRNFLLLMIFGLASLPFTYLLSFTFKVPSTGLVRLSIFFIISGVFAFMTYFVLSNEIFDLGYIADPLGWVFLLFPHYSLARGMSNINIMQSRINICNQQCDFLPACVQQGLKSICTQADQIDCTMTNVIPELRFFCTLRDTCCANDFYTFKKDGLLVHFTALLLIFSISFLLLFAIEYRWLQNLYFLIKKPKQIENIAESEDGVVDSDVLDEKMKVRTVTPFLQSTKNLVVKDLTKFYKSHMAVNQLCVAVSKSECFGLLGVNGAGKTSTFRMLTGDASISSGEAWVEGISIKTNMNQVHQRIGYCPQFDALFEDLTGRETLRIFALLRGVPGKDIPRISMRLADEFNFTKHLDKRVKAYSGGNKRKLSTALSLIGDPSCIYLDEPTSGMDVGARRQLWNMVIKARNSGKSVILTSHSMEECEVLCTRLAIMVNGEFKCLGSTQHLKNKFSKGFYLTIKVGYESRGELDTRVVEIKNFVNASFTGAILKEEYMDILTYHIPTTHVRWSLMFGIMEEAKSRLNIADYSLGQTSLEQVFLLLTKHQKNTT